jgi:phosphatidate cytidylyltransferase
MVGSTALALCLLRWIHPELPGSRWVLSALVLGVGVSLLAHLGDLAESAIKRAYQAKDSGRFLPGHGGILDRMDSILFVAPFVFYYVKYWLL